MTPKEKAIELYNRFYMLECKIETYTTADTEYSVQCALIAVDYIIRLAKRFRDPLVIKYWQEVKQEIEKL